MTLIGTVLYWAATLYIFALFARVILDLLMIFARDWQPSGFVVVLANAVYKVTDPPLRFIGRVIPPLRLGGVALDLGFIVLFIAVRMLQTLAISLM